MCDSSLRLANHLDFESGGMRAISIAHCAVFSDEIILQILSLLLTSEHVKCSRISVSQMSRKETPLATAPFSARTRTIGIGEGSKVTPDSRRVAVMFIRPADRRSKTSKTRRWSMQRLEPGTAAVDDDRTASARSSSGPQFVS